MPKEAGDTEVGVGDPVQENAAGAREVKQRTPALAVVGRKLSSSHLLANADLPYPVR